MTRNRLSDLNDHLFAQLARMSDPALTPEQIEVEAARARAIVDIADRITETAEVQLRAAKLFVEHGNHVLPLLPQIGRADATGGKP